MNLVLMLPVEENGDIVFYFTHNSCKYIFTYCYYKYEPVSYQNPDFEAAKSNSTQYCCIS